MRSDMAKVIVERPRLYGGIRTPKGSRRQARKVGLENLPRCEGIGRPWRRAGKSFNEHLGPLGRYLDDQVGRPWNEVFSEISAHTNRNSVVQNHIRTHVFDFVVVHVVLIDGVPCHGDGRSYGEPIRANRRWHSLYVCPETGILRRTPNRYCRPRPAPQPAPEVVRIDGQAYERKNGQWRLLTCSFSPGVELPLVTWRFVGNQEARRLGLPRRTR